MSAVKCQMNGCDGDLDLENTFPLQTGRHSYTRCCACLECGRVHSYGGGLMFSRQGHTLFVLEGELKLVLEEKNFQSGERFRLERYLYVSMLTPVDDVPEIVKLEADVELVFEKMEGDAFRFHNAEGTVYLLHRGDINFIAAI
jgi:hypothetical protein